ncbi:MAG: universal stress protein [Brooklawnia sp.]|uniref:universal stress protein n=1 Tax=Brooklawnia sp. TaxID=2699740 RepID=UPI003C753C0E
MIMELQTRGRIVVGTDGSERAYRAVQWAADRAGKRNLPLLILHIVPENQAVGTLPAAAYGELASTIVAEYQTEFVEQARLRLDQLADRVRADNPGLVVESAVVEGGPAAVLAEASRDAELVVVGARGATAPRAVKWLGGVSDDVANHAHGPVAVITDEAHENPTGPVVVGVDDSPQARAAVELAFQAAEVRGVPVLAVHAYTVAARHTVWEAAAWEPSLVEVDTSLATQMVEGVLSDAVRQHPGVPYEVRLAQGRPQDVLVEASDGAGLVVVGSRGRGGFRGLLLGSTSKHVLRESHSPVIVTRG